MMKKQNVAILCMAIVLSLSGCGSEIVESAVTETQVIDVSEPSAVEQAVQNTDYDFVDETQAVIELVQSIEDKAKGLSKEEKNEQASQWYNSEFEQAVEGSGLWFSAAGQDQITFYLVGREDIDKASQPNSTCITPQQAANTAGRLFAAMQADESGEIHLICMESALPDQSENTGRLYYMVQVGASKEEWRAYTKLDAVTGELINFGSTQPYEEKKIDKTVDTNAGQAELQGYLDIVGAGQKCTNFSYRDMTVGSTYAFINYDATIDTNKWKIMMINEKIAEAYMDDGE